MQSKYIVYALVDPRSLLVRYVGKSSSGLARPKQHLSAYTYNKDYYVSRWVKSLFELGLKPAICVLDTCNTHEEVVSAEIWWIAVGRCFDWPLTNLTSGGEGNTGWVPSEDTHGPTNLVSWLRLQAPEELLRAFAKTWRRCAHQRRELKRVSHLKVYLNLQSIVRNWLLT